MANPKPLRSKLGKLPEDALYDEVLFDPDLDAKMSAEQKEWLAKLVKDRKPTTMAENKPAAEAKAIGGKDGAPDMAMDWSGTAALVHSGPVAMAFDRASVREKDADGRLHVAEANICAASVCPYFGHEIPDADSLGLDPDKKYMLLRDPEELAKPETVASFNQLPILDEHIPVSAETHSFENTIGSTGSNATYEHPFIKASLVFWPQGAIDDIESNKKKELSPAYWYRADMTPGEYEGQRYDGVMRNVVANHLALVAEGRQGPAVVVGDAMNRDTEWSNLERALRAF